MNKCKNVENDKLHEHLCIYICVAEALCFAESETESTDITNLVTQDVSFYSEIQTCQKWNLTWNKQSFQRQKQTGRNRKITSTKQSELRTEYIHVGKTLFIRTKCFSYWPHTAFRMRCEWCSNFSIVLWCDCHDPLNVSMHSWKKLYVDALMPLALLLFALHVPLSSCVSGYVREFLCSVCYYLAISHRLLYFA